MQLVEKMHNKATALSACVPKQMSCDPAGGADQHSEEVLPSHLREELLFSVQRSEPAQHAQPH